MTLALTSTDQTQLVATLEALLSPLASPSREDWYRRITPELQLLFRGDTTLVVRQVDGEARHFSADAPDLAPQLAARSGFTRGEFHISERSVDRGLVVQRQRSMAVFTSALFDRLVSPPGSYRRSALYNDVCVPNGARATLGLRSIGPDGEMLLGINCERPTLDLLSEDTLALLSLVLPAFRAGMGILSRLERSRATLATTLDTLGDGMLVVGLPDGRKLYRNHALLAMLADEPARDALEQRIVRLARRVHALAENAARSASPAPPVSDDVATTGTRYLLRVTYLSPGSFSRDGTALVAVQASAPALPSAVTLRARFGLTQREAQIAIALARGASDAELARTLDISPHTVRHHAESVFSKLGIHSRKAIALHLMQ